MLNFNKLKLGVDKIEFFNQNKNQFYGLSDFKSFIIHIV